MNFKSLSIALALTLAAGASFAADIDLSGGAFTDADTVLMPFGLEQIAVGQTGAADVSLNTAVIFQDGVNGGQSVAFIDQNLTETSVAVISQTSAAPSLAYIGQNNAIGAVAVINQH